jgi:hypothetical protein
MYLENLTGIVTSLPVTMACWFQAGDVTNRHTLMSIGQGTNANDVWALEARGDVAGDPVGILQATQTGPSASRADSGTYSANTWTHACGVIASTTSRTAYKDGVAGTTDTTSVAAPSISLNRVSVGTIELSSRANFLDGIVSQAAVWSVALDAAEINALAKGVCPTLIRPQSLVAYWPLFGNDSPELDRWRNSYSLTLVNSPVKEVEYRTYYPLGPRVIF